MMTADQWKSRPFHLGPWSVVVEGQGEDWTAVVLLDGLQLCRFEPVDNADHALIGAIYFIDGYERKGLGLPEIAPL